MFVQDGFMYIFDKFNFNRKKCFRRCNKDIRNPVIERWQILKYKTAPKKL